MVIVLFNLVSLGLAPFAYCRYSVHARQVRTFSSGIVWNQALTCYSHRWEYPFFAAWDTAFHCIPLAVVDPTFAKKQLDLLTREWYMKPDGQIPAYEWNFGDVNPPVHAWYVYSTLPRMYTSLLSRRATFRVFKIERKLFGREDLQFLERVFQKLLLNFTW